MTGRNVSPIDNVDDLEPGDYGFHGPRHQLWVCLPNGKTVYVDHRWTVREHDDGTVTVNPSLNFTGEPPWHGWLIEGVFRDA